MKRNFYKNDLAEKNYYVTLNLVVDKDEFSSTKNFIFCCVQCSCSLPHSSVLCFFPFFHSPKNEKRSLKNDDNDLMKKKDREEWREFERSEKLVKNFPSFTRSSLSPSSVYLLNNIVYNVAHRKWVYLLWTLNVGKIFSLTNQKYSWRFRMRMTVKIYSQYMKMKNLIIGSDQSNERIVDEFTSCAVQHSFVCWMLSREE